MVASIGVRIGVRIDKKKSINKNIFILLRLHQTLNITYRCFLEAMDDDILWSCGEGSWKTLRKPPVLDERPLPCHIRTPGIESRSQLWYVRDLGMGSLGPLEEKCGGSIYIHIYSERKRVHLAIWDSLQWDIEHGSVNCYVFICSICI